MYDWLRGLHIIAVIALMAGFLILPRLFVYQMRAGAGTPMEAELIQAQARLFRIIMNPALIAAWVFGLGLLWIRTDALRAPEILLQPWMITKLAGVLFLSGWHGYLSAARRRFAAGTNTRSERYWRMVNELPFLVAIIMVLSVTVEWTF